MNRKETLTAADAAVSARADAYGSPEALFHQIAERWSLHLLYRHNIVISLSSSDVAAMMIEMKQARLSKDPSHADSWVDIAGYAACGAEVATKHKAPDREVKI
jgi:hypothetical protein